MKPSIRASGQRGTAIVLVMALLAIMCVFMVCTARSLYSVKRELNLIEKRQIHRIEQKPPVAEERK